jgi:hypothetical protein
MTTPDLSKPACPSFFKAPRAPKQKKKSAAEKRPGMSDAHLKLISQLPCCIPGCIHCAAALAEEEAGNRDERLYGIDPHHLKCMGGRGMGMRATDRWAVPMCRAHHDEVEHKGSAAEFGWFEKRSVNPIDLANSLWGITGNLDAMRAVMQAHRSRESHAK